MTLTATSGRLKAQLAWVTVGKLFAALVQALMLLLMARWIGPARFGILSAALAGIVVAQTVFDVGISTYVIRERAADQLSTHIRRALMYSDRLSLTLSLFAATLLFIVSQTSSNAFAPLILLAVTAGADRNADCWLGVILSDGDALYNSLILTGRRIIALGLLLGLVKMDLDPTWSYCAATAFSAISASALAHRLVAARLADASDLSFMDLYHRSKHFWHNSLYVQLRNLDVFLVAAIAGTRQGAFYSIASRITGPIRLLPTSLASVLLPSATRYQFNQLHYRHVVRLSAGVLGLSWVIYAGLLVLIPRIILLTAGSRYEAATLTVQIVVVGLCFASTVSILNALFNARGLSRLVSRTSGGSTMVCLLLVAALAPRYGSLGGGIALSVSYVANCLVLIVMARRVGLLHAIPEAIQPNHLAPVDFKVQSAKEGDC